MTSRIAGALSAVLLTALLAGCSTAPPVADGPDATPQAMESAAAPTATQLAQTQPSAEPTRPSTCPSAESLAPEPEAAFQAIHPGCLDYAVALAAAGFPEPLPAGVGWPAETLDFSDPDVIVETRNMSIQYGVQDTTVAQHWLCAWMDEYLQATDSGNQAGQEESLSYLSKYPSLPSNQANAESARALDASLLEPARTGDPSRIREFYDGAGCPEFRRNA